MLRKLKQRKQAAAARRQRQRLYNEWIGHNVHFFDLDNGGITVPAVTEGVLLSAHVHKNGTVSALCLNADGNAIRFVVDDHHVMCF